MRGDLIKLGVCSFPLNRITSNANSLAFPLFLLGPLLRQATRIQVSKATRSRWVSTLSLPPSERLRGETPSCLLCTCSRVRDVIRIPRSSPHSSIAVQACSLPSHDFGKMLIEVLHGGLRSVGSVHRRLFLRQGRPLLLQVLHSLASSVSASLSADGSHRWGLPWQPPFTR